MLTELLYALGRDTGAIFTRRLARLARWSLTFAAGVLLVACDRTKPSQDSRAGAAARTVANLVTVRLHMTGLLLVVPPKKPDQVTNVLVPRRSNHWAVFGFRIDAANPPKASNFCANPPVAPPGATAKGMCYVNLAEWDIAALGALPPSTKPVNLETFGLINVTNGSGLGKKIVLADIRKLLTSLVVLNAGSPVDRCSLAWWTYHPNGKSDSALLLSNVLRWDMTMADTTHLVFVRRTASFDTVLIPIIARAGQRTEMVLANIPEKEIPDLPPAEGGPTATTIEPGQAAVDFDVFYDLIGVPAGTPDVDPRRPLPHLDEAVSPVACPVSISRFKSPLLIGSHFMEAAPDSMIGVRTYACMPATAEIGP